MAITALYWLFKPTGADDPLNRLGAQDLLPITHTPAPPYDGRPGRELPEHTLSTALPEIAEQPNDGNIAQARVFSRRLVPVGVFDPQANASFGEFLRSSRGLDNTALFETAKAWLESNGDSRWAPTMKAEVASGFYKRGRFEQASDLWQELWQSLRANKSPAERGLADEALGHLLRNALGTGRAERLQQLLVEAAESPRAASLEGELFRASQALYLLEHVGAQSVMCGPLALNAIQQSEGQPVTPVSLNTVPASYIATGLPLSQVGEWARDHYQLPMVTARREDAAKPIPTPAVMHSKDDHYMALVDYRDGRYQMVDKARGFSAWVDADAIDAVASDHFLLPEDGLGDGFALLAEADARNVFGRDGAHGTGDPGEGSGPGDDSDDDKCRKGGPGMPYYFFNLHLAAISVRDTPLLYDAPYGPDFDFTLVFQGMDSSQPVTPPAHTHTGMVWQANLVSYLDVPPAPYTNSTDLILHERRGGIEVSRYDSNAGIFGPHDKTFTEVRETSPGVFLRSFPDGTIETYSVADNPATPTKLFLSSVRDSAGNTMTFTYDGSLRLVAVNDALGQVTTLNYDHAPDPWLLTSVVDPFGRSAVLNYNAAGFLASITDQGGLTSSFTYSVDGLMTSMTTPYGTTLFRLIGENPGLYREVEAEDPNGDIERVLFKDPGARVRGIDPASTVVVDGEAVSFPVENDRLQFRNTYHWTKEAWHAAPNDTRSATSYRWMTDAGWLVLPVFEAIKQPLQERVWYSYPGRQTATGSGSWPYYPGMGMNPNMAMAMVDESTPQLSQTHRNPHGRTVKEVDPLGRTTEYRYAANGVDVVEILQTTSGISERQAAMVYDAQRNTTSFTNASGQVWSYSYNARGQLLTTTSPLGDVVTFGYDANGCLASVDGPLAGAADTLTFGYDSLCRVTSVTDPDGYTIISTYDAMDRPLRLTYPDGTYEEFVYDRLDVGSFRNRAGGTVLATYDANQNLTSLTDPLGRVTTMTWCRCGDIRTLTDPLNRTTTWEYDWQGRLTSKVYPDGSEMAYSYHPNMGWQTKRVDEKGQTMAMSYSLDGKPTTITYPGALQPTSPITVNYGHHYPRVVGVADGEGTHTYSYHPVTNGVTLGAGSLASIDGPLLNDTITYAYDGLGRRVSTSVGGTSWSKIFDASGRVGSVTNMLGTFTAAYEGGSGRMASITGPMGESVQLSYHPNSGDRQLQQIMHKDSGAMATSQFDYDWDVLGRVTQWDQQFGTNPADAWTLSYDSADQLLGVNSGSTNYSYTYDLAGNRLTETVGASTVTASYNLLNQLTHQSSGITDRSYEWDAEDRLVAVVDGIKRSEFSYDAGHRIVRQVEKNNGSVVSDRRYLWDGYQLLEERSALGTTVLRRFAAQGEQDASSSQSILYRKDHLASTRELVDASGVSLDQVSYDPWGRMTSSSGNAPFFGFTGIPLHSPSGMHLTPIRPYEASSGRWLSRDPLGERIGTNLYLYAENGPSFLTDRSGLWTGWDDAAALGVGAAAGLAGQGLTDLWNGQLSSWECYAASGVGGGTAGVSTLYVGPIAGGAAGGAAGNLTKQALEYGLGKRCKFDWNKLAFDTALGGATGGLGDKLKIPFKPGGNFATPGQQLGGDFLENTLNAGLPAAIAGGSAYGAASQ